MGDPDACHPVASDYPDPACLVDYRMDSWTHVSGKGILPHQGSLGFGIPMDGKKTQRESWFSRNQRRSNPAPNHPFRRRIITERLTWLPESGLSHRNDRNDAGKYLQEEILAEIEWKLNHRPRKSLGFRTPLEYCKQLFNFVFSSVLHF